MSSVAHTSTPLLSDLVGTLSSAVVPNKIIAPAKFALICTLWAAAALLGWEMFHPAILPSPSEIISTLPDLLGDGLLNELIGSFSINLQALAISTIISLGLAYISVVPLFRPLGIFVGGLRFLSPAALLFAFGVMLKTGHELKLGLLVFAETVYFTTTMMGIVAGILKEEFDDVRTLRMTEWQSVWYVVIRGTFDQAIDTIRQNAAMGWAMLTMVEGLVRAEGGVGKLILDNQKYLNLSAVYAVAACIIAVGLLQDYSLTWIKATLCPYSVMGLEKR